MDVFYVYNFSTAGWLALQSLPLLLSPKLIVTMLSIETRIATGLEEYLARALGLSFLTVAILNVLLTGSVPLTSTFAENTGSNSSDPKSPFASPTLTATMVFHSVMAFFLYTQYVKTGQTMFAFHVAGYGTLAAMGLWSLLFASSVGKVSRKTGADKRTSGFPFSNAEADKRKAGNKRI